MTAAVTLRPRAVPAEGLRLVVGRTSKDEILEFCPNANVGAPEGDPLDLRWCILPNGEGVGNGEWILKSAGLYKCWTDHYVRSNFHVEEAVR